MFVFPSVSFWFSFETCRMADEQINLCRSGDHKATQIVKSWGCCKWYTTLAQCGVPLAADAQLKSILKFGSSSTFLRLCLIAWNWSSASQFWLDHGEHARHVRAWDVGDTVTDISCAYRLSRSVVYHLQLKSILKFGSSSTFLRLCLIAWNWSSASQFWLDHGEHARHVRAWDVGDTVTDISCAYRLSRSVVYHLQLKSILKFGSSSTFLRLCLIAWNWSSASQFWLDHGEHARHVRAWDVCDTVTDISCAYRLSVALKIESLTPAETWAKAHHENEMITVLHAESSVVKPFLIKDLVHNPTLRRSHCQHPCHRKDTFLKTQGQNL